MPENLKALRLRIKSIKQTKKITRAMEMVSASKLRKTEGIMKASRPFMLKIQQLIGRLALSTGAQDHPLFQKSDTGIPLLVVFTSDRGLAGAFNANILKLATKTLNASPETKVIVIGRKGRDYMRRYFKSRIIREIADLNNRLDGAFTDALSAELQAGFEDGKYSQIDLLFPRFNSTVSNTPIVERYLPLEAAAFGVTAEDAKRQIDYILEPTPERVFDAILPRFLKSKVFLTLVETYTSEHSSRMMAMNNATKNCDELGDALTLRLNKARQAQITTEIIEIVSGAEALNG
jgi:F-type H+-transporting ATPase subunit gamma